jgi:hypothetical protein
VVAGLEDVASKARLPVGVNRLQLPGCLEDAFHKEAADVASCVYSANNHNHESIPNGPKPETALKIRDSTEELAVV